MPGSEQLPESVQERLAAMEASLARIEAFNAVVLEAAGPWLKSSKGRVWLAMLASKGPGR